jgi:hypothetical protein
VAPPPPLDPVPPVALPPVEPLTLDVPELGPVAEVELPLPHAKLKAKITATPTTTTSSASRIVLSSQHLRINSPDHSRCPTFAHRVPGEHHVLG